MSDSRLKRDEIVLFFQLAALRKNVDMDGNVVEDNYRPPQGRNGRTVFHHDPNAIMIPTPTPSLPCYFDTDVLPFLPRSDETYGRFVF